MTDPTPLTNGHPATNGVAEETKKAKKHRKKEEKRQRALLERFPAAPTQFDAGATTPLETAHLESSGQIQDWLRPTSLNLNNNQLVAAQKSSALIAINCLMLSFAALSIYREVDSGRLWWALLPLALTNVLSLLFAILSAQVRPNTTLDELCAMPEEEYGPALDLVLKDKEHLHGSLRHDLRLLGADLSRRQKHLRTAYNVLLGGIPLATLVFGLSVALSARSP